MPTRLRRLSTLANGNGQPLAANPSKRRKLPGAFAPYTRGGRTIHTSRPGVVIGKSGKEITQLEQELKQISEKDVKIQISEIKRPELDAYLVAENIANQLKGRVSFRRAMKMAITAAMRMGAEGIRIMCSGRLGGAEMARTEQYKDGRIPLHTLRAEIDYPGPQCVVEEKSIAGIFFTSGSTGPPKGVVYHAGTMDSMVKLIKGHFSYTPEDIDLCTFPLLGLFFTYFKHVIFLSKFL